MRPHNYELYYKERLFARRHFYTLSLAMLSNAASGRRFSLASGVHSDSACDMSAPWVWWCRAALPGSSSGRVIRKDFASDNPLLSFACQRPYINEGGAVAQITLKIHSAPHSSFPASILADTGDQGSTCTANGDGPEAAGKDSCRPDEADKEAETTVRGN